MISAWLALRAVGCLRRIAKALESIAAVERDRLVSDYPPSCEPPEPRKASITRHTTEELNNRWLAKQK